MYYQIFYMTTSGMSFTEITELEGTYDELVQYIKNEIQMKHWLVFPGKSGNFDTIVKTKCIEYFEVIHASDNLEDLEDISEEDSFIQ